MLCGFNQGINFFFLEPSYRVIYSTQFSIGVSLCTLIMFAVVQQGLSVYNHKPIKDDIVEKSMKKILTKCKTRDDNKHSKYLDY